MQSHLEIQHPEKANICKTCGTRYAPENFNREECPVCLDDRQYLKDSGQQWVSYNALKQHHAVKIDAVRENVYELTMLPSFAIGQKAHLICTDEGNVLWDCIPLLDKATAAFIMSRGGLKAIAISHPHFYSLMAEWAAYFRCPVYLHTNDRNWVMDSKKDIVFWEGDRMSLFPGMNLIRLGGHFPGSTILHHKTDQNNGMIFAGDTLYLSHDRKHISAMYSYPNVIPLPPDELFRIFSEVGKLDFDSYYGAFAWQNIHEGAKSILTKSKERYSQIYRQV